MPEPTIHILGIRHHGPGSARSVLGALASIQPDVLLIEGPPEAGEMLAFAVHDEMRPPVALLLYVPDEPKRAVFYPFAEFSPEWQAIRYGLTHDIPIRLMDLPQAHLLALEREPPGEPEVGLEREPPSRASGSNDPGEQLEAEDGEMPIAQDPLGALAEAAGYADGERWWEQMVEQRRDSTDLFAGVLEAMTAVREASPEHDPVGALREAHMRQTLRAAIKEGFQRIVVVCGAWHAPALATLPAAKEDAERLKGLPKTKVAVTWVPWTYGRLSAFSGYGAGIDSPGWYHHLWESGQRHLTPSVATTTWLTQVAQLMRSEDLDVSTAHIIEAVRLAETLAAMRGHPLPELPELTEATQAVFCFGSDAPLQVIAEKLIVSERLGQVPLDTPAIPFQLDLQREQRRLRLAPEPGERMLDLDLRQETDLARSHLLHRLTLLSIPWGKVEGVSGKTGTFHEMWRLHWQPEFAVAVIEAGRWGNTVYDAAAAFVCDYADRHPAELAVISLMLDKVLLADLPDALRHVMACLETAAALTRDVQGMMDALPPLVQVLRYGNVRQTDTGMVGHIVDGVLTRVCIGLPGACAALNDEAAAEMLPCVIAVNQAVNLEHHEEHMTAWNAVLLKLADQQGLHGLIAGRCCRILADAGVLPPEETARRMGLAISTALDPQQAGAWVEGFLQGSGMVLLHDSQLWEALDAWVADLREDAFTALLPLLRRTFSSFPAAERRQLGERARRTILGAPAASTQTTTLNTAQAEDVLGDLADLF